MMDTTTIRRTWARSPKLCRLRAYRRAEASFGLAEDEIGETYSLVTAHGVLSLISLHRNDLSRAEEAASAAARESTGRGPGYRTNWAAWSRSHP